MAYLGLFSHQLRLFDTACSQYQQLAATLLVLHRIQLISNPPNEKLNLEGLRAIEFMKQSIQSMERSFRSLSGAAQVTFLGGNMGPGTTTPVENMGSVLVNVPFEQIPLEEQRPNTIHGANSNISTFHPQAAALGALCKPARRKRKQRLRKQLNKEPFTNTESWTGPSPSYPSDKRDIDLSPIPVVKTEHEGTTPADLDDVHPSRRSQVTTRPFLGRTNPSKGSKSLQFTSQAEGNREVSFRSNDSATATEPHIKIEREASPPSSLHGSPAVESHISRGVEMLTNPFLKSYSIGRSRNTTGTQSLAAPEPMPAEIEDASAFASQYASITDHVMADRAKRGHNSDEEDITASKKMRCTVGSFLEQITERQSESLPKTEAPPPHVTDEQSAVIMQVLAPADSAFARFGTVLECAYRIFNVQTVPLEPGRRLEFGFNVQFTSFFLTSDGKEVYDIDTEHGTMPFVAIAMICDQPRIRLIPVTRNFNLQSEVYGIELADAERGQDMVGKLVKMGCTVVQRPEG
ncbi:MAG: hypothetical protein Q9178_007683 [Gyalolechia marmorata]